MRPYIVWPWTAGLSVLLVGILVAWRELRAARGLDRVVVLGPVVMAAPLAAFSAEHFTLASSIQNMVPAWMPAHLFVAYFVGASLVAAAVSLALGRFVGLSASLLALMFVIFVLTLHVPNAIEKGDRFTWAVALRDLSFGAGAIALAGAMGGGAHGSSWMRTIGRSVVGLACIVFGVLHVLFPTHAPGVPLPKMLPPWIPVPSLWGYLTGAIEIIAGGLMLIDRRAREAAAWLGLVVVVLVLVVYLPLVPVASEGGEKLEALNYVWDTLLFAAAVLAIAQRRASGTTT